MRRIQHAHALTRPFDLWLMARGELVPTLESPYFVRTCEISSMSNAVMSC